MLLQYGLHIFIFCSASPEREFTCCFLWRNNKVNHVRVGANLAGGIEYLSFEENSISLPLNEPGPNRQL